MKIVVGKKQIIGIKEFMYSYIGKEYTGNNKLTHNEMNTFLYEKGCCCPEKVKFDRIKQEQLLTGEYVAVKDESSQIIFYRNPKRTNLQSLLIELNSKANLDKIKSARRHNLNEQGYQEVINGVVKKEELEEDEYTFSNPNRQKQFAKTKIYRKRQY